MTRDPRGVAASQRFHRRSRDGVDVHVRIIRARYGLRGVTLGEASHPGPPRLFLRGVPRQDVVRDIGDIDPTLLDALEVDLQETQVDLIDVTAHDSDSTESFFAVDSRSEVLSDDQERDGASIFEGGDPVEVDVP